jgi:predicted DsbA family dithiol-disulfide isomerase
MTLTIALTSDFICPWCLIGERRLAKAIGKLPSGVTVEQKWRAFELNPDMRPEGMDRQTYRSLKFGSWERSQMLDAHTVEAAKDDDIAFDYAAIAKTPNTFLAHRMMRLAECQGVATPIADATFSAYFEHGRDIGEPEVLVDIAVEHGLEREEVNAFLASGDDTREVREAEQATQASGVRSVPLFDIDGEIVSGAQSVATFEAALRRAIERTDACSTGACSRS